MTIDDNYKRALLESKVTASQKALDDTKSITPRKSKLRTYETTTPEETPSRRERSKRCYTTPTNQGQGRVGESDGLKYLRPCPPHNVVYNPPKLCDTYRDISNSPIPQTIFDLILRHTRRPISRLVQIHQQILSRVSLANYTILDRRQPGYSMLQHQEASRDLGSSIRRRS
jgi:hypothetical protein